MTRNVKRILLVEPEGVLAEVTAFRLELLGYSVETVDSPNEAMKKLRNHQPDVIITDLVLNDGDATGFIEQLASTEETSDIPIMVLSIDADLDRVSSVHKAGAADFLLVPFHPEVLEVKVAALANRPRSSRESKTALMD
jgi:two-component system nitrogen regulation response regulator GlnG